MSTRSVVFFVYPGIKLLDLSGSLQVFSDANDCVESANPAYRVLVTSPTGGPIKTDTLLAVDSIPVTELHRQRVDTFIVVGGRGVFDAIREDAILATVKRFAKRSRRVVSICNGTFLLAETGLLGGKRVTTHWDACELLDNRYPELTVCKDQIYVRDDNIWTSAGVTAGIDLSLALVQQDLGRPAALSIARRLVTYMVRPGGQSQFSDMLARQTEAAESRFAPLIEWMSNNLEADLCVEALAERAHMSARSFSRHFRHELGLSPAKFVETVRVSAAKKLLEESAASIFLVAQQCGFNDEERMRRAFLRNLNVSPSDYRSRFV